MPTDGHERISFSLVTINFAPEVTGIGVYSAGLAEFLAAQGHRTVVYTGFPYYPGWRKRKDDRFTLFRREAIAGVDVRRTYLYVPPRPSVAKRILHEVSFVASASLAYLLGPRTRVTMIVGPPLLLGLPLTLLARLKGSRTIFHVQDLQPDAAVDLGMLKRGPVVKLLYAIERWTYRAADAVSAISAGMAAKIASKGVPPHKLVLFRNWANDQLVQPGSGDTAFRREWGLEDRIVVLYSGNLGVKQGLETLLTAAVRLKHRNDIAFVVVGDGGEKPCLMAKARDLALDNLQFRPLQPRERLSELLATADIAVVPQKGGVTDIVLPSKIANIMSSARPVVVSAAPGTELHGLITQSRCGMVVAPDDPAAMADAIASLADRPEAERLDIGMNGRWYVERELAHRPVLEHFEGWLQSWAGNVLPEAAPATKSGTP